MTDLHEPLESHPDELPPPRQRDDVNLVSLLSMADDLAKEMSALHIRTKCSGPESRSCPGRWSRRTWTSTLRKSWRRSSTSSAAPTPRWLGRCVLGADFKEDCSTEGANLQLNVWDDTTRPDTIEDGITGRVAHTVEAARRTMADPASRKILLAFNRDDEGLAVCRAIGLGPDDAEQFLYNGLTLRPEHRAG